MGSALGTIRSIEKLCLISSFETYKLLDEIHLSTTPDTARLEAFFRLAAIAAVPSFRQEIFEMGALDAVINYLVFMEDVDPAIRLVILQIVALFASDDNFKELLAVKYSMLPYITGTLPLVQFDPKLPARLRKDLLSTVEAGGERKAAEEEKGRDSEWEDPADLSLFALDAAEYASDFTFENAEHVMSLMVVLRHLITNVKNCEAMYWLSGPDLLLDVLHRSRLYPEVVSLSLECLKTLSGNLAVATAMCGDRAFLRRVIHGFSAAADHDETRVWCYIMWSLTRVHVSHLALLDASLLLAINHKLDTEYGEETGWESLDAAGKETLGLTLLNLSTSEVGGQFLSQESMLRTLSSLLQRKGSLGSEALEVYVLRLLSRLADNHAEGFAFLEKRFLDVIIGYLDMEGSDDLHMEVLIVLSAVNVPEEELRTVTKFCTERLSNADLSVPMFEKIQHLLFKLSRDYSFFFVDHVARALINVMRRKEARTEILEECARILMEVVQEGAESFEVACQALIMNGFLDAFTLYFTEFTFSQVLRDHTVRVPSIAKPSLDKTGLGGRLAWLLGNDEEGSEQSEVEETTLMFSLVRVNERLLHILTRLLACDNVVVRDSIEAGDLIRMLVQSATVFYALARGNTDPRPPPQVMREMRHQEVLIIRIVRKMSQVMPNYLFHRLMQKQLRQDALGLILDLLQEARDLESIDDAAHLLLFLTVDTITHNAALEMCVERTGRPGFIFAATRSSLEVLHRLMDSRKAAYNLEHAKHALAVSCLLFRALFDVLVEVDVTLPYFEDPGQTLVADLLETIVGRLSHMQEFEFRGRWYVLSIFSLLWKLADLERHAVIAVNSPAADVLVRVLDSDSTSFHLLLAACGLLWSCSRYDVCRRAILDHPRLLDAAIARIDSDVPVEILLLLLATYFNLVKCLNPFAYKDLTRLRTLVPWMAAQLVEKLDEDPDIFADPESQAAVEATQRMVQYCARNLLATVALPLEALQEAREVVVDHKRKQPAGMMSALTWKALKDPAVAASYPPEKNILHQLDNVFEKVQFSEEPEWIPSYDV